MNDRSESWLSVWGRRALTIPSYLALASLYLALLPLTLVVAVLVDACSGTSRRFARSRALAFFALYLACEVLGILGALLIGLLTFGGLLVGRARYLALNAALQRFWTDALFHGSTWIFGMRVEADGLEHATRGPLLLFVRHTSTADTVLTAALVANRNRILLRYVLKRELLWDPCLDLVGRRLPNAFVARSGSRDDARRRGHDNAAELEAVASLGRELDDRSAVLLYPEGTRFSTAKRDRAVALLREKGYDALAARAEHFRHVLPPKLGGAQALLESAPNVDVVLVEHTGFEGAATFRAFWDGELIGKTIRLRLRRFASATIPTDDRAEWLYARWSEVDDWVDRAATAPHSGTPSGKDS